MDNFEYKIKPDQEKKLFNHMFTTVSRERKEQIIEWFFNYYPDENPVIMGDTIIIKDRKIAMHFQMVWG